jgi:hypothetical protein
MKDISALIINPGIYPLTRQFQKNFVEPILICNHGSQTIWQKSKNRPDNCQFVIGAFMKTVNYLKVLPNLKVFEITETDC